MSMIVSYKSISIFFKMRTKINLLKIYKAKGNWYKAKGNWYKAKCDRLNAEKRALKKRH